MEVLLAMDKIIKTVKSLCDCDEVGMTYNELLVLIAIRRGHTTLKGICSFLLVDKGHAYRVLTNLLEKEAVAKTGRFHSAEYALTEGGEALLKEAWDIKDFIVDVDFGEISRETHEIFRTLLKTYEEKLVSRYFSG